jgi:hypothetical protein
VFHVVGKLTASPCLGGWDSTGELSANAAHGVPALSENYSPSCLDLEGPDQRSVVKQGSSAGDGRKTMPAPNLDHRHCMAIIIEIGDRLRMLLSRESTVLPRRLEKLLQAMRYQEK